VSGDADRLVEVVEAFRGRRVVVIADFVSDEFVYGRVERISREAPVLILRYDATDVRLGGGAPAVHNISTLGATPVPFAVLGRTGYGLGESTYLAPGWKRMPDLVAENTLFAVERILGREAE